MLEIVGEVIGGISSANSDLGMNVEHQRTLVGKTSERFAAIRIDSPRRQTWAQQQCQFCPPAANPSLLGGVDFVFKPQPDIPSGCDLRQNQPKPGVRRPVSLQHGGIMECPALYRKSSCLPTLFPLLIPIRIHLDTSTTQRNRLDEEPRVSENRAAGW